MGRFFYSKFAINNIKKQRIIYIPFILVCSFCSLVFYLLHSLKDSSVVVTSIRSNGIYEFLTFGSYVVIILSVLFIVYANSYVIKRRKKEYGLYSVLGLEKRHILRIQFMEVVVLFILSMGISFICSLIFGRLGDLILIKLLHFKEGSQFVFSIDSYLITLLVYFVVFIILFIDNISKLSFSRSIDLLKGRKIGEKEPKANRLIAFLSILFLTISYALAMFIRDPETSFSLFFVAVIFVIIGTYCLFISGSVFFLKVLKKNDKIYYQPKYFFSISSLMYRLKQNASGLASICILSTMVLVTISTTIGLYAGATNSIEESFPYEINLTIYHKDDIEIMENVVNETAEELDVKINNPYHYTLILGFFSINEEGKYVKNDVIYESFFGVYFMSLEEYTSLTHDTVELSENEAIIISNPNWGNRSTLCFSDMDGYEYQLDVVKEVEGIDFVNNSRIDADSGTFLVVVRDSGVIEELFDKVEGDRPIEEAYEYHFGFNLLSNDSDLKVDFTDTLIDKAKDRRNRSYFIESQSKMIEDTIITYGGLLFIGIFLGSVFLIGTILIIYYKQISEGYEDKERFLILQKVGMSQNEVKKTIQQQIIIFFFLPLILAVIHVCFASNMLMTSFKDLGINNGGVLFSSTVITVIIFSVIYFIVYKLSARVYYKLVRY